MTYTRIFDPAPVESAVPHETAFADRTDPLGYVYSEKIILAVNVALAAGRPLLVRGPSGIGKSSLARSVARHLGWSYVEMVVTARTEARDLLWRTDHLGRLRDAQVGAAVQDQAFYTTPGALFWAFDPDAAWRLLERTGRTALTPPGLVLGAAGVVVLIDEIDKAEPDVPNSLLEPFGALAFDVEDLGLRVASRRPPLVVVTTNEERDLPRAFLRRCVEVAIDPPDEAQLVAIAASHVPDADPDLIHSTAALAVSLAQEGGRPVSAAEFLDTLRACITLGVRGTDDTFPLIAEATIWKRGA